MLYETPTRSEYRRSGPEPGTTAGIPKSVELYKAIQHGLVSSGNAAQTMGTRSDPRTDRALPSGHLRPDIVARHPRTGKLYVINVKLISPLQTTNLHQASWETGYAEHKAVKFQSRNIWDAIRVSNHDIFVPFCVGTFGRVGKQADQLLKEVTLHLHPLKQVSEARATFNRSLWKGDSPPRLSGKTKGNMRSSLK